MRRYDERLRKKSESGAAKIDWGGKPQSLLRRSDPTHTAVTPVAAGTSSAYRSPRSWRLVQDGLARARVTGRRLRRIEQVWERLPPGHSAASIHQALHDESITRRGRSAPVIADVCERTELATPVRSIPR